MLISAKPIFGIKSSEEILPFPSDLYIPRVMVNPLNTLGWVLWFNTRVYRALDLALSYTDKLLVLMSTNCALLVADLFLFAMKAIS